MTVHVEKKRSQKPSGLRKLITITGLKEITNHYFFSTNAFIFMKPLVFDRFSLGSYKSAKHF